MKQKSKQQITEKCQALWNEFDPLCLSNWDPKVAGEYRYYVPYTVELLVEHADRHKFTVHVESCVYVNIGLSRSKERDNAISAFVLKLLSLNK